jgi:hypothetical protein
MHGATTHGGRPGTCRRQTESRRWLLIGTATTDTPEAVGATCRRAPAPWAVRGRAIHPRRKRRARGGTDRRQSGRVAVARPCTRNARRHRTVSGPDTPTRRNAPTFLAVGAATVVHGGVVATTLPAGNSWAAERGVSWLHQSTGNAGCASIAVGSMSCTSPAS